MTAERASAPPPRSGEWYWFAELSCLALGLALAMSTTRLFSSGEPTTTLVVVAIAAWALAIGLRRSPLPPLIGDMTHLALGAVMALWVIAPESRLGPLPTFGSLSTLGQVVRDDFSQFNQDIAPMAARPGHLLVLAALIWVLALFCSTTAMRLRAPVQASLPHIVAIVGLGFVARDQARTAAALLLLGALAIYVLAQGAWRNAAYRWQPPGRSGNVRSLVGAAAILAGALVVTAALAPLSPVEPDPVLDLRRGGLGDGGGPRTVVSPFVEVGSNLGPRSDALLFSATAEVPGYWRLTSLEDYDPDAGVWALANTYGRVAGGQLEGTADESVVPASSDISVANLGGIWVPSPADPIFVNSATELNWDPDSGSLVSRSGDLATGDSFDYLSQPIDLSAIALEEAQVATSDPGLLDAEGAPVQLTETAARLTSGLSPYASALALQDWLRGDFIYDETVNYSSENDPLEAFLDQRSGFCQQFSTAFALAARSVGLPSRVVVGFTTGATGEDPDSYDVYGRNAHAWPEVLFSGIGWVPFEPTPGRGNPATSDITGVPPAQAAAPPQAGPDSETADEQPTTTEAPSGSTPPDSDSATGNSEVTTSALDSAEESGGSGFGAIALVALAVALGIGVGALVLRRRNTPRRSTTRDPVSSAWQQACALLAEAGFVLQPQDTPIEFAQRVRSESGVCSETGLVALGTLAEIETVRRWSPLGTNPSEIAEAQNLVVQLREAMSVREENTERAAAQTG